MEDNAAKRLAQSPEQSGQAKEEALKLRLATATARAVKAQDKRNEREAKGALEKEVLAAEQDALDVEALEMLEAEYGADKIGVVTTEMGIIVLKRCGALRYKKFQDLENAKTLDIEKLVRPCVIYPDNTRFELICAEQPATLLQCGNKVAVLAGVKGDELAGK